MKNVFQFANQVSNNDRSFSKFSQNDILSPESMNRIKGGDADGGGSGIIIPPNSKP
jgi:hypothetical protein